MLPTIVVPIYNGHPALVACLQALRDTVPAQAKVILVDDASTDIRIKPLLESFKQQAEFEVEIAVNEFNLGFVGSVNKAFSIANCDVILLNSDTVPCDQWLQRIMICAASDPRIATITPFSNNAEICSFPIFCVANPSPQFPNQIAQAIQSSVKPSYPELPTAVGFCMFVRHQAIIEIGDFDFSLFGHGYGEENDFCVRAHAHGWRNVLCDDAYVVHQGGVSFSQTSHRPGGENLSRLCARYPHYNALIANFINNDPLAEIRQQAIARMQSADRAALPNQLLGKT